MIQKHKYPDALWKTDDQLVWSRQTSNTSISPHHPICHPPPPPPTSSTSSLHHPTRPLPCLLSCPSQSHKSKTGIRNRTWTHPETLTNCAMCMSLFFPETVFMLSHLSFHLSCCFFLQVVCFRQLFYPVFLYFASFLY